MSAAAAAPSSSNRHEKIWYEDPARFLTRDNAAQFIPDRDMTFEQQLNALVRLALYFSLVLVIVRENPKFLFVAFAALLFTYVLHSAHVRQRRQRAAVLEQLGVQKQPRGAAVLGGGLCTRPTRDNPFMNVQLADLREFPSRPPACDITRRGVQRRVQRYFDADLPRDVGDVFGREASDRQFYTAPVTTVPNEQTEFAEWLYRTGRTCKEGNGRACPGSGMLE
jgi:hypothetical protein